MTIDEAIEELTRYRKEHYSNLHPYFSQAVDLGIEALDYINTCQNNPNCFNIGLLPSQTKD